MKTIEQAAGEYAHQTEERNGFDMHPKTASFQGFIDGVEFAQRWISVEDELPENGELVLVAIDNCFIDVVCARIILGKWDCRLYVPTGHPDFIIEDKVTHWRPIEYK